jgi:hypothetical protein
VMAVESAAWAPTLATQLPSPIPAAMSATRRPMSGRSSVRMLAKRRLTSGKRRQTGPHSAATESALRFLPSPEAAPGLIERIISSLPAAPCAAFSPRQ